MCYSDRTASKKETTTKGVPMKNAAPAAPLEATPVLTAGLTGLRKRSGSTTFGTPPPLTEADAMTMATATTAGMTEEDTTDYSTTSRTMSDAVYASSFCSSSAKDSDEDSTSFELEKYPIVRVTFPLFLVLAIGTKLLAKNFPYVLAPHAATHTYIPAHWHYDPEDTHFDNTAWTWGTDYWLTAAMSFLAFRCLTAGKGCEASYQLRVRSASLLILYAISTLAGGYAHHHYTSIDDLNTWSFRLLWTVCVGTVTSAGAVMLWIGSELCRKYHANVQCSEIYFRIPTVPGWFCVLWAVAITGLCVVGLISYKRPACDIFVAGTTQVVPTAYLILISAAHKWRRRDEQDKNYHACDRIKGMYRLIYSLGFLLNCPLLPMYPLLVQYTDMSLGAVNALLHAWLTVSWGMQAIGLRHFCLALNDEHNGGDNRTPIKAQRG